MGKTTMVNVKGRCPRGCGETIFLSDSGRLTCSYVNCPDPAAIDRLIRGEGYLSLNISEVEAVHFHYTKHGVSKRQTAARKLADKMLRFLKKEDVASVSLRDDTPPDWSPPTWGTVVMPDVEVASEEVEIGGMPPADATAADSDLADSLVLILTERCACEHGRWAHADRKGRCFATGCPCQAFAPTGEPPIAPQGVQLANCFIEGAQILEQAAEGRGEKAIRRARQLADGQRLQALTVALGLEVPRD